ncbi:GNAT family N-acetyltransferase [Thalassospira sp. HF15]|uniref:GNAT family N-acetyltransferase n=1 Tax=Thalassospira sp. HF15 TaxID=2722755 RepID=UPI00142F610C|nr:GNAT family protein [Thalassospira sp. HF15]NIY75441.1 GNAT family N-acetyltransferase [Thalassospira sp. HF15]
MSKPTEAINILGKATYLKTFTYSDICGEYLEWLNNKSLMAFSNQRFHEHSRASCEDYIRSFERSPSLFMGIYLKESNQLVGTISAHLALHHRTADLGILIGSPSAKGKGLGVDAWCAMMDFLFRDKSIRKITAGTLSCNKPMIRVAENSGMELEAIRKEQELVEDKPYDMLYFAKFSAFL